MRQLFKVEHEFWLLKISSLHFKCLILYGSWWFLLWHVLAEQEAWDFLPPISSGLVIWSDV